MNQLTWLRISVTLLICTHDFNYLNSMAADKSGWSIRPPLLCVGHCLHYSFASLSTCPDEYIEAIRHISARLFHQRTKMSETSGS